MKNTLKIYIPSRGRAKTLTTPYVLPEALFDKCVVVVRPDEIDEYKDQNIELASQNQFLVLPKGVNGLSATRQWIIEQANERFHAQLDDDITGFCYKPRSDVYGGVTRMRDGVQAKKVLKAVDVLMRWIREDGLAHVGISERFMAARPSEKPYYENNRLGQFTMWDLSILRKLGARFDRIKLMQDLDMNLQLLEAGYPSRVLTRISYVAKPEQFKGGCALYRDDEMKRKMCDKMARLHKGIVQSKVKIKFGRTYYHLRTSWRKALIGRE